MTRQRTRCCSAMPATSACTWPATASSPLQTAASGCATSVLLVSLSAYIILALLLFNFVTCYKWRHVALLEVACMWTVRDLELMASCQRMEHVDAPLPGG